MVKAQGIARLGRFEVVVMFALGMTFSLYCLFGILKPPSLTTLLSEIKPKYSQKQQSRSTAPDKGSGGGAEDRIG